jgi:hypothetical protein
MAATYPIRVITADEFEALCDVSAQAFLKTWPPGANASSSNTTAP